MSVARAQDLWGEYFRRVAFGDADPRAVSFKRRLMRSAVSAGVRTALKVTWATTRMSAPGQEDLLRDFVRGEKRGILLSWHNRVVGMLMLLSRQAQAEDNDSYRMASLISASEDGELLARPIRDQGGQVARGSSSRDALAALREALAFARRGYSLTTVGDGPRGPSYELKAGAVVLSKLTGMPVYPITWAGTKVAQLHRAWDQLMIPMPFSRIQFRLGEPLQVAADADDEAMAEARRELESRLHTLTEWADQETRVGWQIPKPKPGEVLKRRRTEQGAGKRR